MKPALRTGHRLQLLQNGTSLFPAMVRVIDQARQLVHVETYIFEFAGDALQVAEALERAAQRGVVVRLVVDGVGTPGLPQAWQERFLAAGVQYQVYAPLGRLGLLIPSRWRRLHRKLCVVDGVWGFCGGINLIDDLDDVALGRLSAPRLDFSLQITGPLVADMQDTMEQFWWRTQAVSNARRREFRAAWEALREALPPLDLPHDHHTQPPQDAALLLRDNVRHRHDIERAYLKALGEARHEVVIANAYLIPGRKLRRAMALAVARGVRVRLLLQGKYEYFFQYHAARPVHHWLLRAGVEIHEYAPSALHAKVAVVDNRWATVGSTNLDPLSLLLAREANVVTTDRQFAHSLRNRLDQLMHEAGAPLSLAALQQRPLMQRFLDRFAFGLMRALLFVTGHRY
ncbi:MAG: cardiolipin synthase ClsB [Pseudomonadota bacterium]|jgi:cardiolipin synthase A/B